MGKISILSLPGYTNAGPDHWLSHWERQAEFEITRVEQSDWMECDPVKWIHALNSTILNCTGIPFFVAHSIGCLTVAKWAALNECKAAGAMLVAPPDVDDTNALEVLKPFCPVPLDALPFPTIVLASSNDPYCSLDRAMDFATAWDADFINLGDVGHVVTNDGFGSWKEGLKILSDRLAMIKSPGIG